MYRQNCSKHIHTKLDTLQILIFSLISSAIFQKLGMSEKTETKRIRNIFIIFLEERKYIYNFNLNIT